MLYMFLTYLCSKTTAKTTLTQMLNVIFSRMEAQAVSKKNIILISFRQLFYLFIFTGT